MKYFRNSVQAFHDRIKETEETQKKLQSHLNKTLQVEHLFITFSYPHYSLQEIKDQEKHIEQLRYN